MPQLAQHMFRIVVVGVMIADSLNKTVAVEDIKKTLLLYMGNINK